jgi:hypothetical protein
MYFSYSVSCYFAFIVLRKNKNQKTKKKKRKKPKTTPTTFGIGGRLKETTVSTSGSCRQPAATQTGPAATVAILPPVETAVFFMNYIIHRGHSQRAHTHPYEYTRKPCPYEHLRRLCRQILKIDEVTTGASLSTGTSPTIKS